MTNHETFMNVAEQLRKIDIALSLAEDYLRVCKHNNSLIDLAIEDLHINKQKLGDLILEEMFLQDLDDDHAQQ